MYQDEVIELFEKLRHASNYFEEYSKLPLQDQIKMMEYVVNAEKEGTSFLGDALYYRFKENIELINQRILNGTCSDLDLRVYSMYAARLFFANQYVDKNVFNRYFAIVCGKGIEPSMENAFLILLYALNYINEMEKMNFEVLFLSDVELFCCDALYYRRIKASEQFGDCLKAERCDEFDEFAFRKYVVLFVFGILHEFKHLKDFGQMMYFYDETSDRIFKEYVLLRVERNFYMKHHQYILMERRANEYAYEKTFYLLKRIFDEESIIMLHNSLGLNGKGLNELKNSNADIDNMINELYQKISETRAPIIREAEKRLRRVAPGEEKYFKC